MAAFETYQDKDKDQQGQQGQQDEIGESIPELSTPKAAPVADGGQAVSGAGPTSGSAAPKPATSGAFQDFSQFKDANKSKLEAMRGDTTSKASSGLDNQRDAYKTEFQKEESRLTDQAANTDFDEGINADNVAKTYEDIRKEMDDLGGRTIEANVQGLTDAKQSWETGLGKVTGANDTTGVQSLLQSQRGGGSVAGNKTDAMLLRSTPAFREAMQRVQSEGTSNLQQDTEGKVESLGATADSIAAGRKSQLDAIKDRLKGVGTSVRDQISEARADASVAASDSAEAEWKEKTKGSFEKGLSDYLAKFQQDVPDLVASPAGAVAIPGMSDNTPEINKIKAQNAAWKRLSEDPEYLAKAMGMSVDDLVNQQTGWKDAGLAEGGRITDSMVTSQGQADALNAIANLGVGSRGATAGDTYVTPGQVGMGGQGMENLYKALSPNLNKFILQNAMADAGSTPGSGAKKVTKKETAQPVAAGDDPRRMW